MLPVIISTLFLAAGATCVAIESRDEFKCRAWADHCDSQTSVEAVNDDIHWMFTAHCNDKAGKLVTSTIELNDCLGNNNGQLVTGEKYVLLSFSCGLYLGEVQLVV
ncbi:hypothetical protein PWT90_05576 [Aphanocladium album]|nr:hypothetical protein PWT90_05576 [Aphanocladium album]